MPCEIIFIIIIMVAINVIATVSVSNQPDGHALREKKSKVADLVRQLVAQNCHRRRESGRQAEDIEFVEI